MTPIHEHLTGRVMERFAAYIMPEPNTGCWLWGGAVNQSGYGQFKLHGLLAKAHRVALTHRLGRDLRGHTLHSCDTPACVNPDHLREGTDADNAQDRTDRGRYARGYKQPNRTGSLNHRAKLTEADVLVIRSLAGTVTNAELGRRYGVDQSAVSAIVRREKWTHV